MHICVVQVFSRELDCIRRLQERQTDRVAAVKNIVLTGFGHITLLDLDTIDLSNLNRQFLFRKKDVKQSKALVRRPYVSSVAH